jgi:hypothetical protein
VAQRVQTENDLGTIQQTRENRLKAVSMQALQWQIRPFGNKMRQHMDACYQAIDIELKSSSFAAV